jgi:hypothetical protein
MSLALALWILVAPAGEWSWTILDGPFESAGTCERRRGTRLDADQTVCAKLPAMGHDEYAPPIGRTPMSSPCAGRCEQATRTPERHDLE